ncbi:MAG: potassium channel family protein [Hahellaceae bacterium]|jgi:voltage-gated potassium channel|nr:potassium channel family protein [Hahellaceae bacterium]
MVLYMQLPLVVGLGGVAQNENAKAIRWSRRFEWPMLFLAFWIIIEWHLQTSNRLTDDFIQTTDWLIWLFFLSETALLTALVDRKREYLKNNWVNLIIIVTSFPLIWWFMPAAAALRAIRLVVLFSLLMQISTTARRVLSRNHLGTALFAAFILIIFSGFIVAGLDPNIKTPWDGIWWAWVTVTTVGYGDVVPSSLEGRLFGSFLILVGVCLLSLITANFSAFIIAEDKAAQLKSDIEMKNRLEQLQAHLERLEKKVDTVLRHQNQPDSDLEP